MDGFWFVFCRLRVTAEPETIQPISNNSWGTTSRRTTLALEQISAAAVIGYHGPDPKQLLLGMTGIGFIIGLLLLYPIASRLKRKRLA